MTLTESMNAMLNRQVCNELKASHEYLAMAISFTDLGLMVFAQRFHDQSAEEREHALKIVKYLHDTGGKVSLGSLPEPKSDYGSVSEILEAALTAEQSTTGQINELVAQAERENDYTTRSFLQWFVDEQVEEVASMTELLQLVRIAGEQNIILVESRLAEGLKGAGA